MVEDGYGTSLLAIADKPGHIFHRVEFRGIGRECVSRVMLSGTLSSSAEPCQPAPIQNEKGMCARYATVSSDLGEMGALMACVSACGMIRAAASGPFRADGAETCSPEADIAGVFAGHGGVFHARPRYGMSVPCWPTRRFILKPYLQGACCANRCFHGKAASTCKGGEVFLKASCASGSDFGSCAGAPTDRRKPRLANCLANKFAHAW